MTSPTRSRFVSLSVRVTIGLVVIFGITQSLYSQRHERASLKELIQRIPRDIAVAGKEAIDNTIEQTFGTELEFYTQVVLPVVEQADGDESKEDELLAKWFLQSLALPEQTVLRLSTLVVTCYGTSDNLTPETSFDLSIKRPKNGAGGSAVVTSRQIGPDASPFISCVALAEVICEGRPTRQYLAERDFEYIEGRWIVVNSSARRQR